MFTLFTVRFYQAGFFIFKTYAQYGMDQQPITNLSTAYL
jgi:hypothetical protein